MPEININVYCGKCGKGLCRYSEINGLDLTVEPCPNCLESKYDNGYDKGLDEGYEQARSELNK